MSEKNIEKKEPLRELVTGYGPVRSGACAPKIEERAASIDLSGKIGLESKLSLDTGEINFAEGVSYVPINRTLRDFVEAGVVYQPEKIPEAALDKVMCRIYRLINDEEVLRLQGLPEDTVNEGFKYDITVLLPYKAIAQSWVGEFPKTTGHYHTPIPGQPVASPDLYQIIYGTGEIILQRRVGSGVNAYRVQPSQLDPVLIGPESGHTTVNTGECPLVFCNICVRAPHLDYKDVIKFHGAAYYVTRGLDGTGRLVLNPSYKEKGVTVSEITGLKPSFKSLSENGIVRGKPFYQYIKEKQDLDFLLRPWSHLSQFDAALVPAKGASAEGEQD